MTETTTSAGGTTIADDAAGDGPAVVLVAGIFCTRHTLAPLAAALADSGLRAVTYDRRGRGDSGGAGPVPPPSDAVAREVDDLAAVADAVGAVHLYGHSSGAGLAAHAVAQGLSIDRLVLHEPPWNGPDDLDAAEQSRQLAALIADDLGGGRPGDAIRRFLAPMGMPPEMLDGATSDPAMLSVAPTMLYDLAVMNDAEGGGLPADVVASIPMPTLVLVGADSGDLFRTTADGLVALVAGAELVVLAGADHGAPAELVAPPVAAFLTGDP